MENRNQKGKAADFHQLHQQGLLLLPNVWDPLTAALVSASGFAAIATASAAISLSHGYRDGETLPFYMMVSQLRSIVKSTHLPVTADIESGYASSLGLLKERMEVLLETGIVGINVEDDDHRQGRLFSLEAQCERLQLIRKVADDAGIPLFINARTDVYLKEKEITEEERLAMVLERAKAYREAGADGIFPLGLTSAASLQWLIKELQCPVNVLASRGMPTLAELKAAGVKRLSLGPGLLRLAMQTIQSCLVELRSGRGLAMITENPLTTNDLTELVLQHVQTDLP